MVTSNPERVSCSQRHVGKGMKSYISDDVRGMKYYFFFFFCLLAICVSPFEIAGLPSPFAHTRHGRLAGFLWAVRFGVPRRDTT